MRRSGLLGVALAVPPGLPASLNQQLLFVDRLGIVGLDDVAENEDSWPRTWPYSPEYITRLRDAGVAINLRNSLSSTLLADPEAGPVLEAAAVATKRAAEYLEGYSGHVPHDQVEEFFRRLNLSRREGLISRSYVARALAIQARREHGVDAVSLLPVVDEQLSGTIARDEALRITIEALPVPSDRVPPLEIIRFREDSDNAARLLALRVWASRAARGGITAAELHEELAAALESYGGALRQLERNYEHRKAEIVVTAAPDFINTSLGGALLTAAASLFKISAVKSRIFEDERALPGREVSYIIAAERRFGGGA